MATSMYEIFNIKELRYLRPNSPRGSWGEDIAGRDPPESQKTFPVGFRCCCRPHTFCYDITTDGVIYSA